jgi:hypothetical protein
LAIVPFVRKLSHDGTRFYWLVARIVFVVLGILASVVTIVEQQLS